jgi:hypothetical protein
LPVVTAVGGIAAAADGCSKGVVGDAGVITALDGAALKISGTVGDAALRPTDAKVVTAESR